MALTSQVSGFRQEAAAAAGMVGGGGSGDHVEHGWAVWRLGGKKGGRVEGENGM